MEFLWNSGVETRHLATLIRQDHAYFMFQHMASRDKLFWSGVWIFTVATGLASMIFMALAFYLETTGRGALFVEPNKVIAAAELATVATGMVALMILFFKSLRAEE